MTSSRATAPADSNAPRWVSFGECLLWYEIDRNSVAALLRDAMRRLGPDRWTQREGARSADGSPVRFDSADAVRWSISGALMRAQGDLGLSWVETKAASSAIADAAGMRAFAFNETKFRRFDEIRDVLARALWSVQNQQEFAA